NSWQAGHATDMEVVLDRIFTTYLNSQRKRSITLLVITDGIWDGTAGVEHMLELRLKKFMSMAEKIGGGYLKHRWLTIQFIRVGDAADGIHRLEELDNSFSGRFPTA